MDSIIRGANWYCEQINNAFRTDEVKLPVLSRDMSEIMASGGFFSLDIPGHIKPLEAEMDLNGSHDDLRSRFGRDPGDWTKVVYYENLLNIFPEGENTAPKLKGRTVILKGLLNEVNQSGVKGIKASGTTKLKWGTIILYHDLIDGKTVHKFDIKNNKLVIDGVNYTAEHNRMLRI